MGDIPGRAPSGVRLAGDDYQHLVTWNEVLTALLPGSGVSTITVEDADAANVDDIVVRYEERPARYLQVKHTVGGGTPVGTDWLMSRRGNGRSVLQKFYDSWRELGGPSERVEMELVTDRQLDRADPVIACYDTATERLTPIPFS